jgi:hypothetical protein
VAICCTHVTMTVSLAAKRGGALQQNLPVVEIDPIGQQWVPLLVSLTSEGEIDPSNQASFNSRFAH